MLEGLLLVNKPTGMTSHDVVQIVRRKLAMQQIGHTGTLDPMAQGLLILLVGAATKSQQTFQAHDKTYEATLRLGTQTDTGDAAGQLVRTAPIPPLDRVRVAGVLASFQGSLAQRPPAYSAIKVHGRPAYWWARRHHSMVLPARQVQLFELSLIDVTPQTITFRVHCSAGTYIRTLGESIAERLGTVGCLSSLVRFSIGPWSLDEASSLSWILHVPPDLLAKQVQPIAHPVASRAQPNRPHSCVS